MAHSFSRQDRRALEADNRSRPTGLQKLAPSEWAHINRPGERRVECWRSRDFLVQVFAEANDVVRLTISRTTLKGDRWADEISWDDLQRLKRECGRGDLDAVEIYPADRDIVNVANMRHLWITPTGTPFKWTIQPMTANALGGGG